ncbi:PAS domain-containing protein [Sulfurimonas marina]|uniref:PAS domain-containing protein n=1 Tax=Sulfurimonas marina TaxID=2590551 RepID=A0A7M1B0D7_9BACT|nr:PAS domain-containing protein [Sulfurimonas marina]QOP42188.1 PAS domain-containing protein [Sulfurimonas marina]
MKNVTPTNHELIMDEDDFIVSKTDLKGQITYCNEIFMQLSKLSEAQLLGQPHNIIRHPDMPRLIFKLLWERVQNQKEIFAYVKNLSADGSYYWVYANVTASVDENHNIIGYYSVRRKPNEKNLGVVIELYKTLLQEEQRGGIEASSEYLTNLLNERGVSYDEFINTIQNGSL